MERDPLAPGLALGLDSRAGGWPGEAPRAHRWPTTLHLAQTLLVDTNYTPKVGMVIARWARLVWLML